MGHDNQSTPGADEGFVGKAHGTAACPTRKGPWNAAHELPRRPLGLGLDVGSTTAKVAVVDADSGAVLFTRYRRHHAQLARSAAELLREVAEELGDVPVHIAVCGSGAAPLAQALGAHYVQEVVANAVAVGALYPQARCAIELGGQDAKVVFFDIDETTGRLTATDMRMNGSCAGGTGAFIDEIATLLDAGEGGLEALAREGTRVYEISGRCGVFAKTDIQPLRIQGASPQDLALSAFHAIAKQTIGGLAQGLELRPPIVFEGGPLRYNPTLVRVFAERLQLGPGDVIVPEHPETMVALGAALALDELWDTASDEPVRPSETAATLEALVAAPGHDAGEPDRPLFASEAERAAFERRHGEGRGVLADAGDAPVLDVYVGVDAGSTTTKVALVGAAGQVYDTFYTHNDGDAIGAARRGLLELEGRFAARGQRLRVLGLGTTGYGEQMMAAALGADCGVVETVAHARACTFFEPDATFLLDIGGQDMKAVWLDKGVVSDIMLNEACSSGCGSFLENFAATLGIEVGDIAQAAFSSRAPAHLGSRCTVFMTSTVVNAQREGKQAADIMAGLCRSIIENVFTKVVRVAGPEELGARVVVQGGTFRNDAVLRALEEYLGREVVRAPFPGEMGAIGAALVARDRLGQPAGPVRGVARNPRPAPGGAGSEAGINGSASSFIGFDALRALSYEQRGGVVCTGCANSCSRTITRFSTGATYVTGNRCPRGEVDAGEDEGELGSTGAGGGAGESATGNATAAASSEDANPTAAAGGAAVPRPRPVPRRGEDLFALRGQLLFKDYAVEHVRPPQREVIGLPRVLEFWDSAPFWSTFLRALGHEVRLSDPTKPAQFEAGLRYVASDTVCLPAKVVHGHVLDLCRKGVDRILLPHVMHTPPENAARQSPYMCAIVMGYPMVVRNFQDPAASMGVTLDTPVFHWYDARDRSRQICAWACETLGASRQQARAAFEQGMRALEEFRATMAQRARAVLDEAHERDETVVVLAGRPYHIDPFLSHEVSRKIAATGLSVLPVDCLPGLAEVPLDNLLPEVTNNFHARMLEGALLAASDPHLEYVQVVSFGCGHDAILTDEITRILGEVGGKHPLVLKMDESDAAGSIGIRVQSFVETVRARREREREREQRPTPRPVASPPNPYHAPFTKQDKKRRTVLIPNISKEVNLILRGAMVSQGYQVATLPEGGIEQIRLGKRYTHNDICFPCQMVIGETIDALQSGRWDPDEVAVGMVKFTCDCRLSHYAALLRRALDRAGFEGVPVLTTDPVDTKGMHPGVFMLGPGAVVKALWGVMMLDILQDLKRKTKPYELEAGETDRVFSAGVEQIARALERGLPAAVGVYRKVVEAMAAIPIDRSVRKPRVLVTGELLVTYHPGSNFHIEDYLVEHGMEPIFPRTTDQLRKDFVCAMSQIRDFGVGITKESFPITALFDLAQVTMERIARTHPLYEHEPRPEQMYEEVADVIPKTLSCGEGWLMAAEIAHYAEQGVRSFVILQPFGCLPNHVCGRGVTKRLKDKHPGIQILPLDLDPDTSFANVENRLQMLVMSERARSAR